MKYTVNKGNEGMQDILIINRDEKKVDRYIRVLETELINTLTLIKYVVQVEYEVAGYSEIIANLSVSAEYKGISKTDIVIRNDSFDILELVRLPADVLPYVTALLLENQGSCYKNLFKELLGYYNNAIQGDEEPEERDFDAFKIIRTVLSEDYCSICCQNLVMSELSEFDEAVVYVKMI